MIISKLTRGGIVAIALLVGLAFCDSANAETGWSPVVIARGEYRETVQATPIELRPNRPFHFYGNTVRRIHYRNRAVPRPRDLAAAGLTLVTRRSRPSGR